MFFALLIGLWQGLSLLNLWPRYIFPSPINVGQTLIKGFSNNTIPMAIIVSTKRLIIGFTISVLLGMIIGVSTGRVQLIDETVGSLVLGLQGLPSVCWLPLALLWFGLSETAMLFVVLMGSLFSLSLAVRDGIKNMPPRYIQAARNLGARHWRLYLQVILPAAAPTIVSGLKQGWSSAWRSLMAAELLYMSMGLGYLMMVGRELNDMSLVIAVMLIIIMLGLVVDRLIFDPIEQIVRKQWGLIG